MAAKLPLTQHQLQPGETEIITDMPSRHQQTFLRLAATTAAAVCLTATSSLIRGWSTRVLLLHRLKPAAPQYLSNSKAVHMRPGDIRARPAITPWSRAATGLQGCYLSASRATIRSWIVGIQVPPGINITSALPCHLLEHLSSQPTLLCPRPPTLSAAIATAAALIELLWLLPPQCPHLPLLAAL